MTKQPIAVNASDGSHNDDSDTGDFQRYLDIVLKRKLLVLFTFALVVGLTALWTYSRTRIYRATATVIVDRQAPRVLGKDVGEVVDLSTGTYWNNIEYMETQRKVISSVALARAVVRQNQLVTDDAFWAVRPGKRDKRVKRTEKTAANRLRRLIDAKIVRKSSIIEISVQHSNPKVAARLTNAIAKAYLAQNIDYKLSSTTGAVEWLADKLDDLKKQLQSAELALYEFKHSNNIVSVSMEDKQGLLERQMEKLSDELTHVRIKRMALAAQRKQLLTYDAKSDPLSFAAGPVIEQPTIQALKRVYIEQQRKYAGLHERYLTKHPLVLAQKANVDAARKALAQELLVLRNSLESRFQETRDNEHQLAAALQAAKNEALELNKREVTYKRLKRNQEQTAKMYGMVLTRMKEADLSAQLRVNNMRMLDQAETPRVPISPRVKVNLAMGIFFGLLLGLGLAFLMENLDITVKSQEDIDHIRGLLCLGTMPRIPGSPTQRARKHRPAPTPSVDLVVHRKPKSAVAESCRAIRTNLLFASTDRTFKTLALTSPGPREGKTTTAVSLAIAMAQAGTSVLIIDTDMRRPRLHGIFGVPGREGIASILLGSSKIEDAVKTTEIPNLYVLPCGPIPPNPAELCQSDKFKELLVELGKRYDRLLLDTPPVMAVTDAVVLSTLADGMLLVARSGMTSRVALNTATRRIQDVSANLIGCVLNDMDFEKRGYGYYRYRRYGYHRYGYGYSTYGYAAHYGDTDGESADTKS